MANFQASSYMSHHYCSTLLRIPSFESVRSEDVAEAPAAQPEACRVRYASQTRPGGPRHDASDTIRKQNR